MLGHRSPVVTLEKYNWYVPHLTRADGKALLQASKMATGSRFYDLSDCQLEEQATWNLMFKCSWV